MKRPDAPPIMSWRFARRFRARFEVQRTSVRAESGELSALLTRRIHVRRA